MSVDWSNAPDGCTHYDPSEPPGDDNRWMKLELGELFTYDQGGWVLFSVSPECHMHGYITRPKPSEEVGREE